MVAANANLLTFALCIVGFACFGLAIFCIQLYRANRKMQVQLVKADKDHHDARHDDLTGLLNRRGWNEVLDRALKSQESTYGQDSFPEKPLSLAIFDLDQFKQINDQFGHGIGDQILAQFANRLRNAFTSQTGECVARLGGEEFAVLSSIAPEALGQKVEGFIQGLAIEPVAIANIDIIIRCSVGITPYGKGEKPESWMDRADRALYESKRKGGNQFSCI